MEKRVHKRRLILLGAALGLAAMHRAPEAAAGARPVGFGAEADVVSRYLWRGIALSEGPALQPSTWLSVLDGSVTAWGSMALSPADGAGRFEELDLIVDYAFDLRGIEIAPVAQFYLYPLGVLSDQTGEIGVAISYSAGPLSVLTSHAFDVIRYAGSYYGEVGAALEHELGEHVAVRAEGAIGWASRRFNDANIGVDRAALDVIRCRLDAEFYPIDPLYIDVHYEISTLLDGRLRSAVDDHTLLGFGAAVGVEI